MPNPRPLSSSTLSSEITRIQNRPQDKTEKSVSYTPSPSGNIFLDAFTRHVASYMDLLDNINPRSPQPLESLQARINTFLQQHAGISYADFVNKVSPEQFTTNDYSLLPRRGGLRRRLFNYRATLYLGALCDMERDGLRLSEAIPVLSNSLILPIKKEAREPTFSAIESALHSSLG